MEFLGLAKVGPEVCELVQRWMFSLFSWERLIRFSDFAWSQGKAELETIATSDQIKGLTSVIEEKGKRISDWGKKIGVLGLGIDGRDCKVLEKRKRKKKEKKGKATVAVLSVQGMWLVILITSLSRSYLCLLFGFVICYMLFVVIWICNMMLLLVILS